MSCPALDEMFSYAAENYVAPTQTAPGVNVVADVTQEEDVDPVPAGPFGHGPQRADVGPAQEQSLHGVAH